MPGIREILPPQAGVYAAIVYDTNGNSQINSLVCYSNSTDVTNSTNPELSLTIGQLSTISSRRTFTVNNESILIDANPITFPTPSLGNFSAQIINNTFRLIGPPNRIWINFQDGRTSSIIQLYNIPNQTGVQYEPSEFDTLLSDSINYQLLPGETIAPSSAPPTFSPSVGSEAPTDQPTTDRPSLAPTGAPSARSQAPTAGSRGPTAAPAAPPPTFDPTRQPSAGSEAPTFAPSAGSRGPTFSPVGVTSSTFAPAGAITTLGPTPQAITSEPTPGAGGGGGESAGSNTGVVVGVVAAVVVACIAAGVAVSRRKQNQQILQVDDQQPAAPAAGRGRRRRGDAGTLMMNPAFEGPTYAVAAAGKAIPEKNSEAYKQTKLLLQGLLSARFTDQIKQSDLDLLTDQYFQNNSDQQKFLNSIKSINPNNLQEFLESYIENYDRKTAYQSATAAEVDYKPGGSITGFGEFAEEDSPVTTRHDTLGRQDSFRGFGDDKDSLDSENLDESSSQTDEIDKETLGYLKVLWQESVAEAKETAQPSAQREDPVYAYAKPAPMTADEIMEQKVTSYFQAKGISDQKLLKEQVKSTIAAFDKNQKATASASEPKPHFLPAEYETPSQTGSLTETFGQPTSLPKPSKDASLYAYSEMEGQVDPLEEDEEKATGELRIIDGRQYLVTTETDGTETLMPLRGNKGKKERLATMWSDMPDHSTATLRRPTADQAAAPELLPPGHSAEASANPEDYDPSSDEEDLTMWRTEPRRKATIVKTTGLDGTEVDVEMEGHETYDGFGKTDSQYGTTLPLGASATYLEGPVSGSTIGGRGRHHIVDAPETLSSSEEEISDDDGLLYAGTEEDSDGKIVLQQPKRTSSKTRTAKPIAPVTPAAVQTSEVTYQAIAPQSTFRRQQSDEEAPPPPPPPRTTRPQGGAKAKATSKEVTQ